MVRFPPAITRARIDGESGHVRINYFDARERVSTQILPKTGPGINLDETRARARAAARSADFSFVQWNSVIRMINFGKLTRRIHIRRVSQIYIRAISCLSLPDTYLAFFKNLFLFSNYTANLVLEAQRRAHFVYLTRASRSFSQVRSHLQYL